MKKIFAILITVCIIFVFAGCGSAGPASSAPPASESGTEAVEITLNEEPFDYHGMHVRLPSTINLSHEDNPIDQYISVTDTSAPETGAIWFSAMLDTENTFYDSADDTYYSDSAMIYYDEMKDQDNEYWPFEYEQTQLGGTNVLIGTLYKDDTWYTRAYVILETNSILLEYTTHNEQYNDVIRESIDSIAVDEEEIPEIVKATSPEALQENGLRTEAIEAYGLYINMPESYTPVEQEGKTVWVSPDGGTILYLQQQDISLMNTDESSVNAGLSQDPEFKEVRSFQKGVYHGMYITEIYVTYEDENGDETQNCFLAFLPGVHTSTETVLMGAGGDELEETVDTIAESIRYADGWTTDFFEYEAIPAEELVLEQ